VLGQTDEWAGYPDSEAYMPPDVTTTIYHALGIDPRSEVTDILGRPMVIDRGTSIDKLYNP